MNNICPNCKQLRTMDMARAVPMAIGIFAELFAAILVVIGIWYNILFLFASAFAIWGAVMLVSGIMTTPSGEQMCMHCGHKFTI